MKRHVATFDVCKHFIPVHNLKIISASVRPGRKGPIIARWIEGVARATEDFNVDVLDLAEVGLPLLDEPNHPSMQRYEHEHTKRWSEQIAEADAFIFVTAEYNFGYPASLRNALEFLFKEWGYKPAGIVSYGGVSAGTRAANALKADLASLRVVPLVEMVNIPFFTQFIQDDEHLVPNDTMEKAATTMLRELARWAEGLKTIRNAG